MSTVISSNLLNNIYNNVVNDPNVDPTVRKAVVDLKTTLPDVVSDMVKAIAQKLDLAPGTKIDAAKLGETIKALETAIKQALPAIQGAVALMATTVIRDLAEVIGKLLIEQSANQRDSALQSRLEARMIAKADLLGQAAKMVEAAVQALVGAAVSFAITAVASGISIGGSVAALKEMKSMLNNMKEATSEMSKVSKEIEKFGGMAKVKDLASKTNDVGGAKEAKELLKNFEVASTKFQSAQMAFQTATTEAGIYQAVGQLGQSLGNFINSALQSTGKMEDAEGSRLAALAQDEQAQAEVAAKVYDAVIDMMNKMIQFLKDMQDTEVNMMQSITRA